MNKAYLKMDFQEVFQQKKVIHWKGKQQSPTMLIILQN